MNRGEVENQSHQKKFAHTTDQPYSSGVGRDGGRSKFEDFCITNRTRAEPCNVFFVLGDTNPLFSCTVPLHTGWTFHEKEQKKPVLLEQEIAELSKECTSLLSLVFLFGPGSYTEWGGDEMKFRSINKVRDGLGNLDNMERSLSDKLPWFMPLPGS